MCRIEIICFSPSRTIAISLQIVFYTAKGFFIMRLYVFCCPMPPPKGRANLPIFLLWNTLFSPPSPTSPDSSNHSAVKPQHNRCQNKYTVVSAGEAAICLSYWVKSVFNVSQLYHIIKSVIFFFFFLSFFFFRCNFNQLILSNNNVSVHEVNMIQEFKKQHFTLFLELICIFTWSQFHLKI